MNAFIDYVVPSIVILISNVFSGTHGSNRYEIVSALFGWIGGICLSLGFILLFFITPFFSEPYLITARTIFLSIGWFSVFTVITRDYEKILKPICDKFFKDK